MSIRLDTNSVVDQKFVNIPYKHQARDLSGADCIGVAILWLKEQGIEQAYDDGQGEILKTWWERHPKRFLNAMLEIGTLIRFSEVKKYDCLMFILGNEGNIFPSCLGVMVDDRHMLTSTEDRGSAVYLLSSWWKERYWGAIRLHKAQGVS